MHISSTYLHLYFVCVCVQNDKLCLTFCQCVCFLLFAWFVWRTKENLCSCRKSYFIKLDSTVFTCECLVFFLSSLFLHRNSFHHMCKTFKCEIFLQLAFDTNTPLFFSVCRVTVSIVYFGWNIEWILLYWILPEKRALDWIYSPSSSNNNNKKNTISSRFIRWKWPSENMLVWIEFHSRFQHFTPT